MSKLKRLQSNLNHINVTLKLEMHSSQANLNRLFNKIYNSFSIKSTNSSSSKHLNNLNGETRSGQNSPNHHQTSFLKTYRSFRFINYIHHGIIKLASQNKQTNKPTPNQTLNKIKPKKKS